MKRWGCLLAVVALGACGDDTGIGASGAGGSSTGGSDEGGAGGGAVPGGGGEGGAATWTEYCDARDAACGLDDVDACYEQETCARDLLRDGFEEAYLACLATDCNEEACIGDALAASPPPPASEAFANACQDRSDACAEISDDTCFSGFLLADETVAELDACLEEVDCAALDACFDGITAAFDTCESWL